MRHQLVIFDWDGTLMDSTRLIASCLQCACRDLGLNVPEFADAKYVIGLGLTETVRYVAPSLDETRARQLVERYRHHFLAREHEAQLYTGVAEMLSDLHARGIRMAVATGKARRGLERALDTSGLRQWFETTRCADEGFAKPHPDMLHVILDCTGVEPRDALMVGDTIHDLDLAANAGVEAVAVTYGAHDENLLMTRRSLARVSSVPELNRWLTANA
jgi:phosphoglycolate phosphatase